jgi:hypothetical protein
MAKTCKRLINLAVDRHNVGELDLIKMVGSCMTWSLRSRWN